MNTPIAFTSRVTLLRAIVLAASLVAGIALSSAQAAPKSEEAKPAAPISVGFEKSDGDDGPYLMKIANTGSDEIKVRVEILSSVQVHNMPKKRTFPETKLVTGKGMTIKEVAANDEVMVFVKGHSALQLTAPAGTN